MRGVDCVCATEPPCSSGNGVGDAGATSLAQALEKNTTLQTLNIYSEFVVLFHIVFVEGSRCCGLLLVCVLDGGACALC